MNGYNDTYLKYCFMLTSSLFFLAASVFAPGIAAAQEQPLHPLDSFLVKYKIEGNTVGERIQYSMDHGRKLCIKEESVVTMPEVGTVNKNEKLVTWIEGNDQWIVTANLDDKQGLKMKNPVFAELYEKMKGQDPKVFNRQYMLDRGGKVTGEKTVNGEKCEVWEVPQSGATACVTEDFITLETTTKFQDIYIKETATEVKRNAPEPAGLCDLSGITITDTDINKLMRQAPPQQKSE